jgi:hypothetical protein
MVVYVHALCGITQTILIKRNGSEDLNSIWNSGSTTSLLVLDSMHMHTSRWGTYIYDCPIGRHGLRFARQFSHQERAR